MLSSSMQEGVDAQILMPSVPKSVVCTCLEHIYTGELSKSLTLNEIVQVMNLADMYGLQFMGAICADRLLAQVSTDNIRMVFDEFRLHCDGLQLQKYIDKVVGMAKDDDKLFS